MNRRTRRPYRGGFVPGTGTAPATPPPTAAVRAIVVPLQAEFFHDTSDQVIGATLRAIAPVAAGHPILVTMREAS